MRKHLGDSLCGFVRLMLGAAALVFAAPFLAAPAAAQAPQTWTYSDLHDFGGTVTNADGQSGPDGKWRELGPTFDAQGDMYGLASWGGANGVGMVWEETASGQYLDLHDFGGAIVNANGQSGPDGEYTFTEFATLDANGDIFGTAYEGGANGGGMVWEITAAGQYIDLHDFGGTVLNTDGQVGPDGSYPQCGVAFDAGGNMYGTTNYGGQSAGEGDDDGAGMVWEITTSGQYLDLHDFGGTVVNANGQSGPDGALPISIDCADGNLYGTTWLGGPYSNDYASGMLWEITSSGQYMDLHDFGGTVLNAGRTSGPDGVGPSIDVTLDANGDIFGACSGGGPYPGTGDYTPYGGGMVFELTDSGQYLDLHDFGGAVVNADGQSGPDGTMGVAAPVLDAEGNIYGSAYFGGPNLAGAFSASAGDGMAWEITTSGQYLDLHDFGSAVTNADGQSGPDGEYPISGVFFGPDGNLYGATSAGGANDADSGGDGILFSLQPLMVATTTSLSVPTTSVYGQPVTFTATVSPAGGTAVPAGAVVFYNGNSALSTAVTLVNGQASVTTSSLTLGPYSALHAVYTPSSDGFTGSTSPDQSLTVSQASTTTTVTCSPASGSTYGQSLSITATVSSDAPSTATPTGKVSFYDGATLLKTVSLSSGAATMKISTLLAGAQSFTATYAGSTTEATSTSSPVAYTIGVATPAESISASPSSPYIGEPVTFTATLTGTASAPTGSVTFTIVDANNNPVTLTGNTVALTASTSTKSTAAFTWTPPNAETYTLTAAYSGDSNYALVSASHAVTSKAGATTTTLGTLPAVDIYGQNVTLTATVAVVSPAAGAPAGSVTFYDGSTSLGSAPLSGGQASLTTNAIKGGSQSIKATFVTSNSNFSGSSSAASTMTVSPGSAALTVTFTPTSPAAKSTVTLTATEVGSVAAPTGSVTFAITNVNGNQVSSSTVKLSTVSGATASAKTTWTAGAASGSPYTVTVTYTGDGNYAANSGGTTVTTH